MEWAYPIQEHGYRWGVPWRYEIAQSDSGATITLSDTEPDRVGVEVQVTLPAGSPMFTVAPKLVNNTSQAVPVQFWINAALTLGADSMSLDTQFVVPVEAVKVHSRGASGWSVPDAREIASWPQVGEIDLQHYRQWRDYLGFFVPDTNISFMGAYNPETNLAVARLIAPGTPGHKLFAFGKDFWDKSYTDNNSQYFEIWGGANAGFWPEDDVTVAPGQELEWQEQWWPLAELNGLTWVNQHVALSAIPADQVYEVSALFTRSQQGEFIILVNEKPILTETFSIEPNVPLRWRFDRVSDPARIQFIDDTGLTLLDYCLNC